MSDTTTWAEFETGLARTMRRHMPDRTVVNIGPLHPTPDKPGMGVSMMRLDDKEGHALLVSMNGVDIPEQARFQELLPAADYERLISDWRFKDYWQTQIPADALTEDYQAVARAAVAMMRHVGGVESPADLGYDGWRYGFHPMASPEGRRDPGRPMVYLPLLGIARERLVNRGERVVAGLPVPAIVGIVDDFTDQSGPLTYESFEAVARLRGWERLPGDMPVWVVGEYNVNWCTVSIIENDINKGVMIRATVPTADDPKQREAEALEDWKGITSQLESWFGRPDEEPGDTSHTRTWVRSNKIWFRVELLGDFVSLWLSPYDGPWREEELW